MNFSVANVMASSLYHRTNINCRAINDHITCLELITVSSQQANNFREFMYAYIYIHTHTHVCVYRAKNETRAEAGGGWGGVEKGVRQNWPKKPVLQKTNRNKGNTLITEGIYWKAILTAKECKIQL